MIPILDLKPQYEPIKDEIDSAIAEVPESTRFIMRSDVVLTVPNPHRGDISVDLLMRSLRRTGVSRKEWLSTN